MSKNIRKSLKKTKNHYKYPARDSERGLLSNQGSREKQLDNIEYAAMTESLHFLKDLNKGVLVDIGSGEGKYSRFFGEGFKKIISIEPDKSRLKKISSKINFKTDLQLINDKLENITLKENSADLILVIHVLQHISEKSMSKVLLKSNTALKKGGLLLLAFTNRTEFSPSKYKYNIAWKETKNTYFSNVPKEVFNYVTQHTELPILPVHKIKREEILSFLKKNKFDILFSKPYCAESKSSLISKLFFKLLSLVPSIMRENFLQKLDYDNFTDYVVLAKKN